MTLPRSVPLLVVCGVAVLATGCGQRAQRTDLAIAPLPTPVAESVVVDVRPIYPIAKESEPGSTVAGIILAVPPIISAFTPSFGTTHDMGAAALQDRLVDELNRTKAFSAVYTTKTLPSGTTPAISISASVGLRDAIRIHHGGLGGFWYTPFCLFGWPHSTSSVTLTADLVVQRGGTTILKDEVEARDAWWLCLYNWQPQANQSALEFGKTVLATEAAQEIAADAIKALNRSAH